jgi:hypothetical protein
MPITGSKHTVQSVRLNQPEGANSCWRLVRLQVALNCPSPSGDGSYTDVMKLLVGANSRWRPGMYAVAYCPSPSGDGSYLSVIKK